MSTNLTQTKIIMLIIQDVEYYSSQSEAATEFWADWHH